MAQTILAPLTSAENKLSEGLGIFVGAVVAGIAIGLLKRKVSGRVPIYLAIAAGILLIIYGSSNVILRGIGLGLLADGLYDIIAPYIQQISSS